MSKYKRVVKFFLVGQEEAERAWLSQMSKQGYHLVKVNFAIYYVFEKGKPENYTYYIDMKEGRNLDEEYKLMYSDVGLEYIDNTNGYYYFRAKEDADTLAIINNEQGRYMSRLGVQKRLLLLVGIMNLILFGINLTQFLGMHHSYEWTVCINLFCGILCCTLAFKIQFKIRDMKKTGIKEYYKSKIKDYNNFYILVLVCIVLIVLYSIISFFDIFVH